MLHQATGIIALQILRRDNSNPCYQGLLSSGPNGSGKSNILDALLFALDFPVLREWAERLPDLVNHKSQGNFVEASVTVTDREMNRSLEEKRKGTEGALERGTSKRRVAC